SMRLPLIFRSESCVRRSSSMTAARNINGIAATQNNICKDSTFSAMETAGNDSRPCIVYQSEITVTDRRDKLNPAKPNRTAAHNRRGRGRYNRAGVVEGDKSWEPNTTTATATVLSPRAVASKYRARLARRIREMPPEP